MWIHFFHFCEQLSIRRLLALAKGFPYRRQNCRNLCVGSSRVGCRDFGSAGLAKCNIEKHRRLGFGLRRFLAPLRLFPHICENLAHLAKLGGWIGCLYGVTICMAKGDEGANWGFDGLRKHLIAASGNAGTEAGGGFDGLRTDIAASGNACTETGRNTRHFR